MTILTNVFKTYAKIVPKADIHPKKTQINSVKYARRANINRLKRHNRVDYVHRANLMMATALMRRITMPKMIARSVHRANIKHNTVERVVIIVPLVNGRILWARQIVLQPDQNMN